MAESNEYMSRWQRDKGNKKIHHCCQLSEFGSYWNPQLMAWQIREAMFAMIADYYWQGNIKRMMEERLIENVRRVCWLVG